MSRKRAFWQKVRGFAVGEIDRKPPWIFVSYDNGDEPLQMREKHRFSSAIRRQISTKKLKTHKILL